MDYEFDEMRQQMAILKDKLENQTIVNDRFIRRSIKRSVGTINRRYLVIGIVALAEWALGCPVAHYVRADAYCGGVHVL